MLRGLGFALGLISDGVIPEPWAAVGLLNFETLWNNYAPCPDGRRENVGTIVLRPWLTIITWIDSTARSMSMLYVTTEIWVQMSATNIFRKTSEHAINYAMCKAVVARRGT